MVEYMGNPPGIIMQPPEECLCKWVWEWWGESTFGEVLVLHTDNIHRRCPLHGRKPRWVDETEEN